MIIFPAEDAADRVRSGYRTILQSADRHPGARCQGRLAESDNPGAITGPAYTGRNAAGQAGWTIRLNELERSMFTLPSLHRTFFRRGVESCVPGTRHANDTGTVVDSDFVRGVALCPLGRYR